MKKTKAKPIDFNFELDPIDFEPIIEDLKNFKLEPIQFDSIDFEIKPITFFDKEELKEVTREILGLYLIV